MITDIHCVLYLDGGSFESTGPCQIIKFMQTDRQGTGITASQLHGIEVPGGYSDLSWMTGVCPSSLKTPTHL